MGDQSSGDRTEIEKIGRDGDRKTRRGKGEGVIRGKGLRMER